MSDLVSPPSPGLPRVFVVVLNYRHVDDTLRCVASLRRSVYQVVTPLVVDNGSSPSDLDRLRAGLGATTLLTTGANLGYAGGNNVGIRHALDHGADLVWLVNPDVVAEPAALERLVETAEAHPEAGILGSRVLYGGRRPPTIWFNGGVVDLIRGGATSHRDDGSRDRDVPETPPFDVDYVTGAAMLVRREVFDEVGLLPERYFLYFEETDFNLRARDAGWRVLQETRSRLEHHKRSTGRLPAPYYVYYFVRNRILFGLAFSDATVDELVDDLDEWVRAWRQKVGDREPGWLPVFERLVATAVEDARDGRDGRRADIGDEGHQVRGAVTAAGR